MKNEFDIIERYFTPQYPLSKHPDIIKNIGDDCAIIKPDAEKLLVLSTDTLIQGVHFPKHSNAKDIAHKALVVNLSDLAAMGAKPAWFSLALTLNNQVDEQWLSDFSGQLHATALKYGIALVGGDTTRGNELSITIQVHGYVDKYVMMRSQAQVGDIILVSGCLGAAALGLQLALASKQQEEFSHLSQNAQQEALNALNRPQAEIKKGLLVAKYSQCAIDISDGLLADLGHILKQSHCGASLLLDSIPVASCLQSIDKNKALIMALTGGDDYQLCLTLSPQSWHKLQYDKGGLEQTGFYPIGKICQWQGIQLLNTKLQAVDELDGVKLNKLSQGYNHFA